MHYKLMATFQGQYHTLCGLAHKLPTINALGTRPDLLAPLPHANQPQSQLYKQRSPGMGAGSLLRMSLTSLLNDESMKGGDPVAHSYNTQPRDQRSLAVECVAPSPNNSGAM